MSNSAPRHGGIRDQGGPVADDFALQRTFPTAAGPASIVYGLLPMFGVALSELISAMPTSSGQYYGP